jgi:hypothetical protein
MGQSQPNVSRNTQTLRVGSNVTQTPIMLKLLQCGGCYGIRALINDNEFKRRMIVR